MKLSLSKIIVALAAIVLTFAFAPTAHTQDTGSVLYTFSGGADGATPETGLVADSSGNLYGTASAGGPPSDVCYGGCGVVFELSPSASGWTETVLYSFTGLLDGGLPWSNLVFDASGNLYGTTRIGGPGQFGTVFKLTHNSNGTWTETVLYGFKGAIGYGLTDGDEPSGGVVFDARGTLYGTTIAGGGKGVTTCSFFTTDGCGTVFKLTPTSSGEWKETQLYAFTGGADGAIPFAGVAFDSKGDLYGTTTYKGGANVDCEYGCGSVFRLAPHSTGGWQFSHIFAFNFKNGAVPHGRLVSDTSGNLYGTTTQGGSLGCGTVFELSPSSEGGWRQTWLHSFTQGADGAEGAQGPEGPLLFDAAGNLYGTTPSGGNNFNPGVAFELSPANSGGWTLTPLFTFPGEASENPNGGLISDSKGNLYGTTIHGGDSSSNQWGTVFMISQAASSRQ
jgi:uncharacterized repeat protein (TIGR03803 family)